MHLDIKILYNLIELYIFDTPIAFVILSSFLTLPIYLIIHEYGHLLCAFILLGKSKTKYKIRVYLNIYNTGKNSAGGITITKLNRRNNAINYSDELLRNKRYTSYIFLLISGVFSELVVLNLISLLDVVYLRFLTFAQSYTEIEYNTHSYFYYLTLVPMYIRIIVFLIGTDFKYALQTLVSMWVNRSIIKLIFISTFILTITVLLVHKTLYSLLIVTLLFLWVPKLFYTMFMFLFVKNNWH